MPGLRASNATLALIFLLLILYIFQLYPNVSFPAILSQMSIELKGLLGI